jgi:hypothetical protein
VDPAKLRHSFVSVLSDAGLPVEQIGALTGVGDTGFEPVTLGLVATLGGEREIGS